MDQTHNETPSIIPESYPVKLISPVPEKSSRVLAVGTLLILPKLLLLIPHIIVLYVLGIVAFVLAAIGQVMVLFTGKYPPRLYKIVRNILQWQLRINAYFLGLTDKYPPFKFDE